MYYASRAVYVTDTPSAFKSLQLVFFAVCFFTMCAARPRPLPARHRRVVHAGVTPLPTFNSFVMWWKAVVRQVPSVHSRRGAAVACVRASGKRVWISFLLSFFLFFFFFSFFSGPSFSIWMAWDRCNQDSVWRELEVRASLEKRKKKKKKTQLVLSCLVECFLLDPWTALTLRHISLRSAVLLLVRVWTQLRMRGIYMQHGNMTSGGDVFSPQLQL